MIDVSKQAGLKEGPRRYQVIAGIRIAFGLAWATDATLKWLPGFADHTMIGTLRGARAGQPAIIRDWITLWLNIIEPHPHVWAYLLGAAETTIALCLILGVLTNLVALGGGILSLLIWTTAEGLGGPYQSGTTDISASIIYVLVFALMAATGAGATWGIDALLRPRLGKLRWLSSR